MEVNCEGCAGCCVDWRAAAPEDLDLDHERRGRYRPVDDAYNLVVLTRDDVRTLLDAGYADAMTPRLFHADDDRGVSVDGYDLAAVDGRPAFFVGLRKLPKPVAPAGASGQWLPTCAFLDPDTLQCRVHGDDVYPADCAAYPGHNLALGSETECERIESAFDGQRLLDDDPPDDDEGLLLGPQAVGAKVFAYPDPADLDGVVDRVATNDLDREDRARFVAAAAASAPGTTTVDPDRYETALDQARTADSWVGEAAREWQRLADDAEPGDPTGADSTLAARVEDDRGAPPTPGWD